MLDELHVKDLALISEATLLPAAGLTVVTGETGAGKTALLTSLALLAGERADAGAVRERADALLVEGRFVEPDGSETIVSRAVTADGRSRVHVDGAIASVGQLADGIGSTIDLCGQHEHQRLMQTANHVAMLDAWAAENVQPALEAYQAAFENAQLTANALEAVQTAGRQTAEALDAARFTLQRIDEVSPEEDEYDELHAVLARAENAEMLATQVHGAHEALAGERGALDTIGAAIGALEEAAHTDASLATKAESLREASYIVEDVSRDVRSYRDSIDFDAADLARMQERMGKLQGLLRSYGPTIDEVLATRAKAQATIDAVDDYDNQLAAARASHDKAETTLAQAADALHRARTQAAPRFSEAVSAQMQRLELAGSALVCSVAHVEREKWTRTGPDHVEFLFKPAAGMNERPLVRIASGGEISRVMLAIKVVLGAADDVATLVFDEVDAGVGGNAARALAEVLADLAQTHQVLVVTHLPQVAVLGDTHYVVRKTTGDLPETMLEEVRGQARVAEVARMLSGDTGGVARAHAAQMLEDAHHLHAN